MKLEWGKKVSCPACALPFYDLRKTSLLCPNCGHSFVASDLRSKHAASITLDEVEVDEKLNDVSVLDFPDEVEEHGDVVNAAVMISVGEDIEDIKVVD
ncbi:MAG: FYDLN acid domain-containing protein [Holosporales bacterium]|jgi:hypothetical protein|nr:FYDLN acid domain-containing protein [Holosporales bacterium]